MTPICPTTGVTNGMNFGSDLALDGRVLVVGSSQQETNGPESGAVYLFQDTSVAHDWSSYTESKIAASNGQPADFFGHSVALDGSTLVVEGGTTDTYTHWFPNSDECVFCHNETLKENRDEAWARPIPDPDPGERPFYEAADRGELVYQRCPACDHAQFHPRPLCVSCGGDPEWATASGRGTVYTFTVVRQNHASPFREALPYVVAMVELEEGVRMLTNVTGCAPDDVHVGMAVEAYAVALGNGLAVPFWRPARG